VVLRRTDARFIGAMEMLANMVACDINPVLPILNLGSAIMLSIMAAVSLSTGARRANLPMKLPPVIKMVVAILFFLGSRF
jgi:hypothetical protein